MSGIVDLCLRIHPPRSDEVDFFKSGSIVVSFLNPDRESEIVRELSARGVNAISMDLIPRTTRAQRMDALSSQANLAGYVAVFAPSGIGVREAIIAGMLAGTLPLEDAVALGLLYRIWLVVVDGVLGVGLVLSRSTAVR